MEELRERMRLLQGDRRANVELLETQKKMNFDETNLLRDENKKLRTHVAELKRQERDVGADAQIAVMKKELVTMRKAYDDAKGKTTSASAKLEILKDEVSSRNGGVGGGTSLVIARYLLTPLLSSCVAGSGLRAGEPSPHRRGHPLNPKHPRP